MSGAVKYQLAILAFIVLATVHVCVAQPGEVKLNSPQTKITTVAAMRVRKAPQITADEILRLKLATIVNVTARSANQDTIGNKTDYWYRVNLPNGATGWLFGGLLLNYNPGQRVEILRQIIETRLKAENTEWADREETYDLAVASIAEAKDVATRAEFELLKLLALANWAIVFPAERDRESPYREWLKTHAAAVMENEFAGCYNLRSDALWDLEAKYHSLPIADRIAWEAAENQEPSECEGDEVCALFTLSGEIKYLQLHPNGSHVAEALDNLNAALTDDVIKTANDTGGDQYAVEQRNDLLKLLASLRVTVAKTSAVGTTKLVDKLSQVKPGR